MKNKGISVIVKNESDFNRMVKYLGEQTLYLTWQENMSTRETGVVTSAKKQTGLSSGSVGCAKYHSEHGLTIMSIEEYFG